MDYYYDDDYEELQQSYDADYLDENGHQFGVMSTEKLGQVVEVCIVPSLRQIFDYIVILVGWSLVYRFVCTFISRFKLKNEWLQHLLSTICGLASLYCAIGWKLLIILFLTLTAYILMLLIENQKIKNIGLIIAVCTISSHFLYEGLWQIPETWHLLRGTQMIVTMKVISLAFDLEAVGNKKQPAPIPGIVTYLGYIFCPPTSILGPWIPFSVYLRSLTSPSSKTKWRWIFWSLTNIIAALIFVSLSNCISLILLNENSLKWLITLREAFAIRCSHYFICFLSQASMSAGNINLRSEETPNPIFGHMISKPWHIEYPRSLSSLIRSWNIPMHKWLKTYVFQATLKKTQKYFIAILLSFLVSSLLHGMHFRIYLVLLSLGFFAYVENLVRMKLAEVFNACITSNYCKKPCQYTYCRSRNLSFGSSLILIFVNLLFSLVAMMHLAYLGVMLTTIGDEKEDLSLSPGLKKWSDLDYLSHIITIIVYIFYYFI